MPYVMLSRCLPELEEIEQGNTNLQLLDWFQANRTEIEARFKEAVGE
jgi:hypothetical protein